MKKIGNKFIIGVILIISLIVCSQVYLAYSHSNVDTNSYLALVKGNTTLNDIHLDIGEEYLLASGDNIRVIGESSLAVIQWGDGSLTRLGGNTKISIEQNQISKDFTNINISFDLIAGRTWSQVVSFIGSDSSFTQTFDGVEAGVRGTIFDVDLEKEFLHVTDHLVEITDPQGNVFNVGEGDSFSLENFSFIDVSEFISLLEDSAWRELNKQFDSEHISKLSSDLTAQLESRNPFLFILEWISPKYRILYELDTAEDFSQVEERIINLSDGKKEGVYNAVLSKYQSMNFVQANDYENYKRKIFYKKVLLLLSSDSIDSERLLQSAAYDLEDIVASKSIEGITETLELLGEHKDILQNIDMSFLSGGLDYLPSGLLEEFKSSFGDLENILNIDIESLKNINVDSVSDLLDSTDGVIQDFLDDSVGGLLQNLTQ